MPEAQYNSPRLPVGPSAYLSPKHPKTGTCTLDSITENETHYARLHRELTDKLQRTYSCMIEQGGPGRPSLHLLTAGFNFGDNRASAKSPGEDFNASLIDLAVDTLDVGSEFTYDVCDTLRERQNAGGTDTIGPFAVAAIDYPGTEEGWPRASEPPLFNAAILVPAPLKQEFNRVATGDFSNFESCYSWARPQSLKVQEIQYSESGVELAVGHVLKLCRTLPWKVFGEGASICFIRYPFNDGGEQVP